MICGRGVAAAAQGLAVPNAAVLEAIEELGFTVSVHDVVAHTGQPTDAVEAEMAALLRGEMV